MKNSECGMTNSKFKIQNSKSSFPRYERYKDSGVEWLGDLPGHWEVSRSRRVFTPRKELARPDDQQLSATQAYGVIPQAEFEDRIGRKVTKISMHLEKRKHVEPDDFVISMRSFQGGLERAWARGCIRSSYTILQPSRNVVPSYFTYLLKSPHYIAALQATGSFIRDGQDLTYENFILVDLPLPALEEQARIGTFLDQKTAEIDALIAKKQRQIELLDEQKAILINRAVTRGIVNDEFGMRNEHLSSSSHSTFTTHHSKFSPSGIEWIGEIPVGWEVKRIGHLGIVGNGSTPSRSNPRYWDRADYPWLNSGSVNQGIITQADQFVSNLALKECHLPLVKEDSIVIAITGQGKTRGTAALLTIPATINQHLAYIEIQSAGALPKFIHLALASQYLQLRAISESGSTKGALTCQDVKEFKIVLPPPEEQDAIILAANKIKNDLAQLDSQFESQIQSLKTLRSTLIAHAVTGRIKV